ncbi:uncharacterized protein LOC105731396 isoform X5 [Aotus nancymaae]|uniref:uncharacterized protein LOC105731396 isoform X5 n=1 Tax=Aotus nancymaae TaxID=37293 RepID=UPI0030FECD78
MLGLDELERSGCAHCTQAELRLGDAVCRDPGQDKDRNPADPASPPAHRVMAAPALRAPAQSGKHTVGLREEEDQSDSYCPIPGPSGYAGLGLLWQGEPERSGRARRTQVDVRLCEAAGRDLGQENKDRGRRVRVPVHAQSWRLQLSQHRVRLCPDVWTLFLIHQVFSAVDITSHRGMMVFQDYQLASQPHSSQRPSQYEAAKNKWRPFSHYIYLYISEGWNGRVTARQAHRPP